MHRSWLFTILMGGVLLAAATSQSDVPADTMTQLTAPPVVNEPTTGSPAITTPGSENPTSNPFEPYDVGGPEAVWKFSDLTPAEQETTHNAADATGWDRTHNAFASATRERSAQARAEANQHQLGVDNLSSTGVVP